MKKICFIAVLALTSISLFAQKYSVDSLRVNQAGIATVYLTSETGQRKVANIRAIINPKYNDRGQAVGGALESRQGLMLTAPIKPSNWTKDATGNIVPDGFNCNQGFSLYRGTVYIVEGYWSLDGSHIEYTGREQAGDWGYPLNPADWVRQYTVNSFEIPNFCLAVPVTKSNGGYFVN